MARPIATPSMRLMFVSKEDPGVAEKIIEMPTTQPELKPRLYIDQYDPTTQAIVFLIALRCLCREPPSAVDPEAPRTSGFTVDESCTMGLSWLSRSMWSMSAGHDLKRSMNAISIITAFPASAA